jgi:hypothetical protein
MAAQAVGPTADYKIKPEHNSTSPDGTTTVEQYAKIDADGDYTWQFWARHQDKLTLLKPEQADYAAGFRFTNDSQWLVRMQKTGSGESTLYLYRLGPQGFVPATKKPLGDLAWAYFKSRGERSLRRALNEYVDHYHAERNHQGKGNVLLFPRDRNVHPERPVQCRERLGGLLRYYHREAA